MILPTWTGPHAAAYGKERVSCSESELPATSIRDKEGPPKAKPLSELPLGHRPARLQLQALPPACYGQEDTRLSLKPIPIPSASFLASRAVPSSLDFRPSPWLHRHLAVLDVAQHLRHVVFSDLRPQLQALSRHEVH